MVGTINFVKYDDKEQEGTFICEAKNKENTLGGARIYIEDKCLYIKSLYVFPDYRRQHVASELLKFIESLATNGIESIRCTLDIYSCIGYDNLIEFYEKNNYEYNILFMQKTV